MFKHAWFKKFPAVVVIVAAAAMFLGACATTPAGAPAADPSSTPAAPAETIQPQVTEAATPAPVEPSPTDEATGSIAGLIAALQAAGATVEPAGQVDAPLFPVKAENLTVNGLPVSVYEFENGEVRTLAAAMILANGYIIGDMNFDWAAQPNFWTVGNLIVLYVGSDPTLIDLLTGLLGVTMTGSLPGEGAITNPPTDMPAIVAAIQKLSQETGAAEADIQLVSVEQVDWPDGCLGAGGPSEMCTMAIVPGYRVVLSSGGQEYELRTNSTGAVVRLAVPGLPAGER